MYPSDVKPQKTKAIPPSGLFGRVEMNAEDKRCDEPPGPFREDAVIFDENAMPPGIKEIPPVAPSPKQHVTTRRDALKEIEREAREEEEGPSFGEKVTGFFSKMTGGDESPGEKLIKQEEKFQSNVENLAEKTEKDIQKQLEKVDEKIDKFGEKVREDVDKLKDKTKLPHPGGGDDIVHPEAREFGEKTAQKAEEWRAGLHSTVDQAKAKAAHVKETYPQPTDVHHTRPLAPGAAAAPVAPVGPGVAGPIPQHGEIVEETEHPGLVRKRASPPLHARPVVHEAEVLDDTAQATVSRVQDDLKGTSQQVKQDTRQAESKIQHEADKAKESLKTAQHETEKALEHEKEKAQQRLDDAKKGIHEANIQAGGKFQDTAENIQREADAAKHDLRKEEHDIHKTTQDVSQKLQKTRENIHDTKEDLKENLPDAYMSYEQDWQDQPRTQGVDYAKFKEVTADPLAEAKTGFQETRPPAGAEKPPHPNLFVGAPLDDAPDHNVSGSAVAPVPQPAEFPVDSYGDRVPLEANLSALRHKEVINAPPEHLAQRDLAAAQQREGGAKPIPSAYTSSMPSEQHGIPGVRDVKPGILTEIDCNNCNNPLSRAVIQQVLQAHETAPPTGAYSKPGETFSHDISCNNCHNKLSNECIVKILKVHQPELIQNVKLMKGPAAAEAVERKLDAMYADAKAGVLDKL